PTAPAADLPPLGRGRTVNSLHLHVNALRYRTEQNHQETRSLSLQQFNRSRWPIGARELLELIASRRSCRAFDGSEIDPETLRKIVIDGTQAPSSCNQQQWHCVIVTRSEGHTSELQSRENLVCRLL